MLNRKFLGAALTAVITLSSSGVGLAQQVVVSGGAMLPQPLYQDEIDGFPAPAFHSYAATGSINGKAAFLANAPARLGYQGSVGSVHWIGSESPLTSEETEDYLKIGLGRLGDPQGHGPLIQIPAAGTAIAIAYKGPTVDVTLDKAQLCGVLSGRISRWSHLGVDPGSAPDEIKVIYHKEASGVTELLTRHLQAVCRPYEESNVWFNGNSVFAQVFPHNEPPPWFIAATGSDGVVRAIGEQASAITYLGPDPAFSAGLKQAHLKNRHNGTAYAPTPEDVVLALGGMPSLPHSTGIVVSNPTHSEWTSSINQANPANWVGKLPDPSSGYPIVGYTSFVLSQCYTDPAAADAIKKFLVAHYSHANSATEYWSFPLKAARELIARSQSGLPLTPGMLVSLAMLTGMNLEDESPAPPGKIDQHKLIPLSAVNRSRLVAAFVIGTAANLNIGNATVCGNYVGRG